jgi:hypothetical protein
MREKKRERDRKKNRERKKERKREKKNRRRENCLGIKRQTFAKYALSYSYPRFNTKIKLQLREFFASRPHTNLLLGFTAQLLVLRCANCAERLEREREREREGTERKKERERERVREKREREGREREIRERERERERERMSKP